MSDNLDPKEWEAFRASSHRALDCMIDSLQSARERPVWRNAPASVRQRFQSLLPRQPREFAEVLEDFEANIKPYAVGNTHPLFMGWVHGAGTPVGMIAEMLAGAERQLWRPQSRRHRSRASDHAMGRRAIRISSKLDRHLRNGLLGR